MFIVFYWQKANSWSLKLKLKSSSTCLPICWQMPILTSNQPPPSYNFPLTSPPPVLVFKPDCDSRAPAHNAATQLETQCDRQTSKRSLLNGLWITPVAATIPTIIHSRSCATQSKAGTLSISLGLINIIHMIISLLTLSLILRNITYFILFNFAKLSQL